MKLLFVSKDMGAAKLALPVIKLAKEKGHEVTVIAEGLAAGLFKSAGIDLTFQGMVNVTETPFNLDSNTFITRFLPDVVVTTRSSPNNLENQFGQSANAASMPLVLMEDFWAGFRTCRAKPDMVVTLDEYAESLVRQQYPVAKVVIAGNLTVIPMDGIEIPANVLAQVESLRAKFGRVFLFAGAGSEAATAELELLLGCLKLTDNWCLIPRFHPKFAAAEKEPGVKWSFLWDEMLKPFGEQIVPIECKSGDAMAMLADATFSGFSLMLNTAAYARKAAISLWTEKGAESLSKQVGLFEVPLVKLGCARRITQPCDLDAFGQLGPADEDDLGKLKPFDSTVALKAIESMTGSTVG